MLTYKHHEACVFHLDVLEKPLDKSTINKSAAQTFLYLSLLLSDLI